MSHIGLIRFLAEDLVVFLQVGQTRKALKSLTEILQIVIEHLKQNG